jgi:ATP synthase protein I
MLSQQRKLGLALSVGTVISSSVVGGVLLGYLLDRWLLTGPWLTVAGVILGTAGAFVSVYRIIKRLE